MTREDRKHGTTFRWTMTEECWSHWLRGLGERTVDEVIADGLREIMEGTNRGTRIQEQARPARAPHMLAGLGMVVRSSIFVAELEGESPCSGAGSCAFVRQSESRERHGFGSQPATRILALLRSPRVTRRLPRRRGCNAFVRHHARAACTASAFSTARGTVLRLRFSLTSPGSSRRRSRPAPSTLGRRWPTRDSPNPRPRHTHPERTRRARAPPPAIHR